MFNKTYSDIAVNYKLDPEKIIIDPFKTIDFDTPIKIGKEEKVKPEIPTIRQLMSKDVRSKATVRKVEE